MCILRITCFVCYYLSLILLFRVLLFNKLFLSHYRSFFLIYFLRVVFPIKRVILVSVLFYEFRFLLSFYFGHSASRVSRYDKGHTFIFLSYLYVSSISGLEVLCYYYIIIKKNNKKT